MDTRAPGSSGLLGSLRGFADGLIGSVHDRVELLSVELQEEKLRLVQIFIWISAIVVTGILAVIFASLALVFVFWDTARLAVIVGLAVLYGVALVGVVVAFRRYLARQPAPFSGTLAELKEDRACIQPEN